MAGNMLHYLAISLVAYVLYLFCLTIYRLYFHPLASFPGPRTAAISKWPEFYHDVVRQGQFVKVIDQWHDQYGTMTPPDSYGTGTIRKARL